jgi:hypothetical protein
MEEVVASSASAPTAPSGTPIPYPNLEQSPADGDGATAELARKAGGEQQEYLNVKMEDAFISRESPNGDEPADDAGGVSDFLARKAGGKQEDFLVVKMEDVLITSRESPPGSGAPADTDLHPDAAVALKRTDVRDSNDRYANVEESKVAGALEEEDDFESSTLLSLEPQPASKEMLPGLAGHAPGAPEPDVDLDDAADADDSEL